MCNSGIKIFWKMQISIYTCILSQETTRGCAFPQRQWVKTEKGTGHGKEGVQPRREGKRISRVTRRRSQAISCAQASRLGGRRWGAPREDWSEGWPWLSTCCVSVSWEGIQTTKVKLVSKYLENWNTEIELQTAGKTRNWAEKEKHS